MTSASTSARPGGGASTSGLTAIAAAPSCIVAPRAKVTKHIARDATGETRWQHERTLTSRIGGTSFMYVDFNLMVFNNVPTIPSPSTPHPLITRRHGPSSAILSTATNFQSALPEPNPPSSMSMHRSRVFVFFLHISRHLCSGDLRPVSPAGIQRSPQGISGNPARNRSHGTACRASRRSREARRAGRRRRRRADRAKPQGRRTGRRATLARGQAARHDPVPRAASNCALGGKDGRTLFVTAQKGVYSIDVEGARSR